MNYLPIMLNWLTRSFNTPRYLVFTAILPYLSSHFFKLADYFDFLT